MSLNLNKSIWQKLESKAGYPYFVNKENGIETPDHPELETLNENIKQFNGIKYCAYRTAFKTFLLQNKLQVSDGRVSMGVLTRHCLSISESSLTLEPCEVEAVLADVHFACSRENVTDDNECVPQLLLNIVLNIFHPERTGPIRVQAVKVFLIMLSDLSCEDKWSRLVETSADHNGCVSPRRLASLLDLLARVAKFLGEESLGQNVQRDVDNCFAKSAGMLGMSTRSVVSWAISGLDSDKHDCTVDQSGFTVSQQGSVFTLWLVALDRVKASRSETVPVERKCSACSGSLNKVLRFGCAKCYDLVVCESCYLYDTDLTSVGGHKKSHAMYEITNVEMLNRACLGGFIEDFKRLFTCTKYRNKKKIPPRPAAAPGANVDSCRTNGKMADDCQTDRPVSCQAMKGMMTSTVGRAAGGMRASAHVLLQDIICQLEYQNNALKELSSQLETNSKLKTADVNTTEVVLKNKVESHWGNMATQIDRLKILKENLSAYLESPNPQGHTERTQAFDLFSPIPTLQQENAAKCDKTKSQPRVLSLDSGNFSDTSKPSESRLMVVSGDVIRPVVAHATSDSISTVSMNDISMWYNNGTDTESQSTRRGRVHTDSLTSESLSVTQRKYDADLRSVAHSAGKVRDMSVELDGVLDRLQQILANNKLLDDSSFDNTQLRETANEMEGLLGTLIRGVEQRSLRRQLAVSDV